MSATIQYGIVLAGDWSIDLPLSPVIFKINEDIFLSLPMIQSKSLTIIIHVIGWLLFFSLMIGFVSNFSGGEEVLNSLLLPYYLLFFSVYTFLFYINTLVLLPRLYFQKKYIPYFLIILALFVAVYFLEPFDNMVSHVHEPPPRSHFRPPGPPGEGRHRPGIDIISLILFVMITLISLITGVIKQWQISEQRVARAEMDKANAELSFLKAQINPHFLFNTLNNIYTLAVTKSENAPAAIMKLSHIMRYITDEATQDFVPLQSEIDCISNYIDLHRLRLSKKSNVAFSVSGDPEGKVISPLILITFIENVFKYGISNHESSTITIRLVTAEKTINFFCQNTIIKTIAGEQRTGIGIANTKHRLEHLYFAKHMLKITTNDGLYTVELILQV